MSISITTRGRLVAAALTASFAVVAPASAEAATVVVSPTGVACASAGSLAGSEAAVTIHDAIGEPDVSKVLVCPGTYAERVDITKPIAVVSTRGPSATTILLAAGLPYLPAPLSYSYEAVRMAAGATLGGRCADATQVPCEGGFTIKAPEPLAAYGSTVELSSLGVYIPGVEAPPGADVTVEGNTISGFTEAGISVGQGADGARIIGNRVTLGALPVSYATWSQIRSAGLDVYPKSQTLGIVENMGGGPAVTNNVVIDDNVVVAAPGTGDRTGDAGPSVSGESPAGTAARGVAIAALAPGNGPSISGNTIQGRLAAGIVLAPPSDGPSAMLHSQVTSNSVQGADVGIALRAGVEHATVTGNSLSVASVVGGATGSPSPGVPVDPSTNGLDIEDSTTGGVYAFDTRNLIYGNHCFAATKPADGANAGHASPARLCELTTPPEPALGIDGGAVEGIPETVHVTVPSGTSPTEERFKVGGDGGELAGYDGGWTTTHTYAVTPSSQDDLVVHAQARAVQAPATISPPATLRVPVAENQLPEPQPVRAAFGAEGTATITFTATQPADEASEKVTFAPQPGPQHGTLTENADGTVTYTPDESFDGTDSFAYVACDHFARADNSEGCSAADHAARVTVATELPKPSEIALVPLHEDLAGDAPGANAIQLGATQPVDEAGEHLTFRVEEPAQHGDLSEVNSDGVVAYVPSRDFHGDGTSPYDDSFTYVACDGVPRAGNPGGCSEPQTVEVRVESVNDAPIPATTDKTATEDTPLDIQLGGHDVDGDALTYAVVTQPGHGTLSGGDDGLVTYTPESNFNGTDSFQYSVGDGLETVTAVLAITVDAANDLPVAAAASGSGPEDGGAIQVPLSATDADGDSAVYELVGVQKGESLVTDKGGEVKITDASATYAPAKNFNGADSFAFRTCDAGGCSEPQTATVTVTPVNDAPVATNGTARTAAGSPVVVELAATDVEGETLSYGITGTPANGTVTIDGSTARYVPNAGFGGTDTFRFTATDSSGASGEATFSIEVAPSAPSDPGTTGSGKPRPLAGSASRVTGTVLVTLPGGRAKVLEPGGKLPEQAIVNASAGQVTIDLPSSGGASGPRQRVTASQGAFLLHTIRENGKPVLVLRLVASSAVARGAPARAAAARRSGTLLLVVSGACRCRVVTRDAKVSPIGTARWSTMQTAAATVATVIYGRVKVVDRVHPCVPHVLPLRPSAPKMNRFSFKVAWTPLRHQPTTGRPHKQPRC